MRKFLVLLMFLGAIIVSSSMAFATGFYINTNELGYEGTVWNITDSSGPWNTSTPRDANLYMMYGVSGYDDYNVLMSSWFEHLPSNQNDSFLQLAEGIGYGNTLTVTSAVGGWDPTMKIFTVNVTGANSMYPYSRFWQPDNGVAWGVTFTDYSYTFTATFSDTAILDSGFYVNASAPDAIVGSFTGEFVVTSDVNKNPITDGDTYGFEINFSKDLFDPDISDLYGNPGTGIIYNEFGAQASSVPEPATMFLIGSGLAGLAGLRRFRKN